MTTKSAYGASAREIEELFSDYLEGDADRPALVLYANRIGADARTALLKSLAAFGYGDGACSFAQCDGLDPNALFLLVEGLDPLFVIAADADASGLLARTYRCDFTLDSPIRVAGRQSLAFRDLDSLMLSPASKQVAWKLLKTLTR